MLPKDCLRHESPPLKENDPHTLRISPYSVQMRKNADQNNSEYEHFLRSEKGE